MLSKIKSIILSAAVLFAGLSFANAEEISVPGFTGNVNTTVSTGFQMRVDENCLALTGAIDRAGDATYIAAVNNNRSSDASVLLLMVSLVVQKYQDGYGNPVDPWVEES